MHERLRRRLAGARADPRRVERDVVRIFQIRITSQSAGAVDAPTFRAHIIGPMFGRRYVGASIGVACPLPVGMPSDDHPGAEVLGLVVQEYSRLARAERRRVAAEETRNGISAGQSAIPRASGTSSAASASHIRARNPATASPPFSAREGCSAEHLVVEVSRVRGARRRSSSRWVGPSACSRPERTPAFPQSPGARR